MSDMTYICPADAAMKAHREGRITADEARDMVATPSTRATCARCAWPLEIEGLSNEDADRVEAQHRKACPGPADDAVERLRIQLGLKPWREHAATSPSPPRRTGRTARALLEAIVRCMRHGHKVLYVYGGNRFSSDYCQDMARDFVSRLGLNIGVRSVHSADSHSRSRTYIDHHALECEQPAAIRTPVGDITIRADPTLKPGEWRLETPWLKAAEWLATPVVYPEHRKSNAAGTLPCGVWSANGDHVPLTLEPLRRPDGFTQSDVDAAKAVLLSKVERKR